MSRGPEVVEALATRPPRRGLTPSNGGEDEGDEVPVTVRCTRRARTRRMASRLLATMGGEQVPP